VLAASVLVMGLTGNSSADGRPQLLTGNDWTCSHTRPAYMIHAGNARVTVRPGTNKFTARHHGAHFNGVYDTVGYLGSLNSGWYCAGHRAYRPPRNGRQGRVYAAVHDVTSPDFQGDAGFDIWWEPSPRDYTYRLMTSQGGFSTEVMIWLSRPDWRSWAAAAVSRVRLSGRTWYVVAQHVGHGAGWNRIFFVPAGSHQGNITVSHFYLNPFFSWAIRHHDRHGHPWLSPGDYLEAVDQGAEIGHGTAAVAGYALYGLRGMR
jgi:hypothetical protein